METPGVVATVSPNPVAIVGFVLRTDAIRNGLAPSVSLGFGAFHDLGRNTPVHVPGGKDHDLAPGTCPPRHESERRLDRLLGSL
jgi:hypothetical protein